MHPCNACVFVPCKRTRCPHCPLSPSPHTAAQPAPQPAHDLPKPPQPRLPRPATAPAPAPGGPPCLHLPHHLCRAAQVVGPAARPADDAGGPGWWRTARERAEAGIALSCNKWVACRSVGRARHGQAHRGPHSTHDRTHAHVHGQPHRLTPPTPSPHPPGPRSEASACRPSSPRSDSYTAQHQHKEQLRVAKSPRHRHAQLQHHEGCLWLPAPAFCGPPSQPMH